MPFFRSRREERKRRPSPEPTPAPKPEANFGYTRWAEGDLERNGNLRGEYEEPDGPELKGYYQGRRIISRDTRIDGGAYFITGWKGINGEICVVDDREIPGYSTDERARLTPREEEQLRTERPNRLEQSYQNLQAQIGQALDASPSRGAIDMRELLQIVHQHARTELRYDLQKTEQIADEFEGQKIGLNRFLAEGVGVCRHQALLDGYIIERMIDEGKMNGQVSVDRSQIEGIGGHAWVRYTDFRNEPWIIDPAGNFVGTLEEAKRNANLAKFYERPTDKQQQDYAPQPKNARTSGNLSFGERRYGRPQEIRPRDQRARIDGNRYTTAAQERIEVRIGESEHLRTITEEYLKHVNQGAPPLDNLQQLVDYYLPEQTRSAERDVYPTADSTGRIKLSEFVERGVGTPGARLMLAASLLEQLHARGLVRGRATIESNEPKSGESRQEWLRYVNGDGESVIFDYQNRFIGNENRIQPEWRQFYDYWKTPQS